MDFCEDKYNEHKTSMLLNIKQRVENTFENEGGLGRVTEEEFYATLKDSSKSSGTNWKNVGRRQDQAKTYSARLLDKFVKVNTGGPQAQRGQEVKGNSDTCKDVINGGPQRRSY
jgi:GGDEF domain-containing protein